MKRNTLRNLLLAAALPLVLTSSQAFGWTATYLGGGSWAILCANGTLWSYGGGSAGLESAGSALCPAGGAEPSLAARATKGVSRSVNRDVLFNRKELGDGRSCALRTYPPHGYPCLGCAPCPGNPTEFCDTTGGAQRLVVIQPERQCRVL